VVDHYNQFLRRFPSLLALALAPEADVLAAWSGLGYYRRARMLHKAAQFIVLERDGRLPTTAAELRTLPGIGEYTAAAIASIAFGLPHVVLDGNVLRVVARIENDSADIGSARTRERFRAVAQSWLDAANAKSRSHSAAFNQAIMELGATVCLPRNPLCLTCPLTQSCQARQQGTTAQLPVKLRRTQPVKMEGVLLIVRKGAQILLRQRAAGASRMAGFWDLPAPEDLPAARQGERFGEIRHSITHHRYLLTVTAARLTASREKSVTAPHGPFEWFDPQQLTSVPLSTTARKALKLASVL
jgi:A/G-specific adenine glycosylase